MPRLRASVHARPELPEPEVLHAAVRTSHPRPGEGAAEGRAALIIIAIDPGPRQSAWVVWDGYVLLDFGMSDNWDLRAKLGPSSVPIAGKCVLEQVASYGMTVGADVFETVFWTGVFAQQFGLDNTERRPRLDVKMHLCHDSRAKDSNIRQALIDRFGGKQAAIGLRKSPGPLYGVKKDVWQALALAVTWWDSQAKEVAGG